MHLYIGTQDCSNSIADALELPQSYANPSIRPPSHLICLCTQLSGQQFQHGIAESLAFLGQCLSHIICVDVEWSDGDVGGNDGLDDLLLFEMHLHFSLHLRSCVSLSLICSREQRKILFNSLAPGRPGCHFKTAISNLVLLIGIFTSSKDNAVRWMPRDLTDDKSTLVQVMAWCRQATGHYLSQCWPSSMSSYGVTRPQWVNSSHCPSERIYRNLADAVFKHIVMFENMWTFFLVAIKIFITVKLVTTASTDGLVLIRT